MTPQELINKYKISLRSTFVPYSKSRNAGKWESLNWYVTLIIGTKEVCSFDYSSGTAHCPGYKKVWAKPRQKIIAARCEIETGRPVYRFSWTDQPMTKGKFIEPDISDIVFSLVMDAGVLNSPDFETWAAEYDYSSDSISAKETYDHCLAQTLKIRGHLGQEFFDDAAITFEDY